MPASPRSFPYPLGVSLRGDAGANVAIYSETADSVEVCLFETSGAETRVTLEERTGHVFHGIVPDMRVGTRYGLRVDGPWDPANGLRHNAAKLLLDPHATAIEGSYTWSEDVFGHFHQEPNRQNRANSAHAVPRCVVTDPGSFDWSGDTAPRVPLEETVIYEVHVKGFTKLHPDIPEDIRGTYRGLAHPRR